MASLTSAPFGWTRAADAGLTFRRVVDADLPFLARLYASTRAEELSIVPWSQQEKDEFLSMQFRAQHTEYRKSYASADWLVAMRAGQDVGRLYLQREVDYHGVIDITFLPEHRSKGLGSALLRDLMDEAAAAGKPVSIYVEKFNPAMRLYRRLGFTTEADAGVYDRMRWEAAA